MTVKLLNLGYMSQDWRRPHMAPGPVQVMETSESKWGGRAVDDVQVGCSGPREWIKSSHFNYTWHSFSFFSFLFLCHWLGKIKPQSITPNTLLKKVIFQLNLSSEFPIHPSLSRSDLPPLSTIHPHTVKSIYWHRVMMKESEAFTAVPKQGVQASLKHPTSMMTFREMVLNTGWARGWGVCDQLMDVFWLVGGEVIGSQYHQASGFYDHVSTIEWTSSTL